MVVNLYKNILLSLQINYFDSCNKIFLHPLIISKAIYNIIGKIKNIYVSIINLISALQYIIINSITDGVTSIAKYVWEMFKVFSSV